MKTIFDVLRKFQKIKRPGIICTLGTTTDDQGILQEMVEHGMAMARINTKHATIKDFERRIDLLQKISAIPVMLDLNCFQIRLDTNGERFAIDRREKFKVGYESGDIKFNQDILQELQKGDSVLLGNADIRTFVTQVGDGFVELQVQDPGGHGRLTPNMGVNIPGVDFKDLIPLTKKDREVIILGGRKKIRYWGLSFIRTFEDVFVLKKEIDSITLTDKNIFVLKIENAQGVSHLEDILRKSKHNGIEIMVMVANGDMFIEMPPSELAFTQKTIIETCKRYKVPSIVATGLLLSMQHSILPTRAEVSYVSNSIIDGADWLMLSDESSNSHYPSEAVMMLEEIINAWEKWQ
jgi:pyruvate kinase